MKYLIILIHITFIMNFEALCFSGSKKQPNSKEILQKNISNLTDAEINNIIEIVALINNKSKSFCDDIKDIDIKTIEKALVKCQGSLPFSFKMLLSLKNAGNKITEVTKTADVILLIGQSPAYIAPFIKDRNTKVIAASQLGSLRGHPEPSSDQIKKYCKYLKDSGLSATEISSNHLILIDYASSGGSVISFSKLLNHCKSQKYNWGDDLEPIKRFSYINLISDTDHIEGSSIMRSKNLKKKLEDNHVDLIEELPISNLYAFAEDGVPRVIPSYPLKLWNEPPNFDLKSLSQGKVCMEILKALADL